MRRKHLPARFAAILVCLALVLAAWPLCAQIDTNKKKILYLNSYHNGYAWSDQILEGIRQTLDKSAVPYDLQIEYMDTKRLSEQGMATTLERLYAEKYRDTSLDAIIASDDIAFQFLLGNKDRLFPGVPLVFCGVNELDPSSLKGRGKVTGVIESPDFEDNFKTALSLSPQTNRVIVIGDHSLTGQAIRKQVLKASLKFRDQAVFEFWDVRTLQELLEKTDPLTQNDMIFLIPIYLGADKQVFSVEEVCEILSKRTAAPIYSAWRFMLGHGIVGGKLHSGEGEGALAARMALRLMAGESPSQIPVVDKFDDPTSSTTMSSGGSAYLKANCPLVPPSSTSR